MQWGPYDTQLSPWHPGHFHAGGLLTQRPGEPSMRNGPQHQPGLVQAAGKVPTRVQPRFQAEEKGTHLASPTPTQGRAGLELALETGHQCRFKC